MLHLWPRFTGESDSKTGPIHAVNYGKSFGLKSRITTAQLRKNPHYRSITV
jgi:hypothetical protein